MNQKWKQVTGLGAPARNAARQHIEITCENFYHFLENAKVANVLTRLNTTINTQKGGMVSNSYNINTRQDGELINTIAKHLVDKGHYGYLPLKPFGSNHRRDVSRRGETLADRLELNEPRSYFNPSTRLLVLARRYSDIIKNRLTDLFFPGTVSNTFESDPEHANAYEVLRNEMLEEARYLILDVRNGVYIAEEMDYNDNQRTIRIIAKPADLDGQMRNGLQPNISGTSYNSVGKRICIYVQVSNGIIEIKSIFPCRNINSLEGGRSNYAIPIPLPVINLL